MVAQTHLACPTALVEAPIDVVWGLLMNTAGWGKFYDLKVLSVDPPGPAAWTAAHRESGTKLSTHENYIRLHGGGPSEPSAGYRRPTSLRD